jgi:hypothetical protein
VLEAYIGRLSASGEFDPALDSSVHIGPTLVYPQVTHPVGSVPKLVAQKPDSVNIRSKCTAYRTSFQE